MISAHPYKTDIESKIIKKYFMNIFMSGKLCIFFNVMLPLTRFMEGGAQVCFSFYLVRVRRMRLKSVRQGGNRARMQRVFPGIDRNAYQPRTS